MTDIIITINPGSATIKLGVFACESGQARPLGRATVDEAEGLGVPMVVGSAVRQFLAVTQAKFGANSDFTNMARVVEEWAGVEIRSKS